MDIPDLVKRCIRITRISRKPTPDEYGKVAKVTALGIVVLGAIGLILSYIFTLI